MLFEKIDHHKNKNFIKSLILALLFLCFANIANAGYKGIAQDPLTTDCLGKYELNEWVEVDSGSTLFNPTVEIHRREVISCVGYEAWEIFKPTECKELGLYRYCARFTEPGENGNDYACNETTTSTQDPITGEVTQTTTPNCDSDSAGLSTGGDCPEL